MKADPNKRISKILFYVVFAFVLTSCRKEADQRINTTDSGTIEAGDANYNSGEGAVIEKDTQARVAKAQAGAESPKSAAAKKRTASTQQTATSAANKKNKLSGYSAPNGTDAENHDGDPYTKNDTSRRPTGPPIK